MILVPLSHRAHSFKSAGKYAMVDECDWQFVQFWNWSLSTGYAFNSMTGVFMHAFLMSPEIGQQIDHVNGDKLDNRRSNLRFCNSSQNQMNRRGNSDNASGYKGVHFDKGCINPWTARIKIGDSYVRLGHYETKEEAAQAYNEAAINNYGPWARINVIR